MSTDNRLIVDLRTEFGKGAARRVRRSGRVPAVLYGHGSDPIHIAMPAHDAMMALKHANALLNLVIDGREQLALAKDVQRNPVKPVIEHVDLVIVRKGEKVTVDVPVHLEGEAASETVVTVESNTLEIQCEATHIPEAIVVDIAGAEAGTQILAGTIVLPEGVDLVTDADALVVNVTAMISQEALDAELAGAEGEAAEAEASAEPAADASTENAE